MRFLVIVFSILVVVTAAAFFIFKEPSSQEIPTKELKELSLVLDWTPNTNHTGIYVAKAKGWYEDEGVDLKILPFSSTVSPDILVSTTKADVGISSTEGVLAATALGEPLVSIAAIVQHNTSSLAVLADSEIDSPSELGGKIYGGFGTPSETAIVSAIVREDGGSEDVQNIVLDVAALEALKARRIDAMWIFEGWEGIQAKLDDVELRTFPLVDYGIPDYYTPVIVTSPKTIAEKKDLLARFMRATAKGYEYTRTNPSQSAQLLIDSAPNGTFPDEELVMESQSYLSPRYADTGRKWGLQDAKMWKEYPQFLFDSEAIHDKSGNPVEKIDFEELYTNNFLE